MDVNRKRRRIVVFPRGLLVCDGSVLSFGDQSLDEISISKRLKLFAGSAY